jgi:GntR family transcriptional regulator
MSFYQSVLLMEKNPLHSDAWSLDPASRIPLHVQFASAMQAKISSGEWKTGDSIPSERVLMQQAGISRATVRQALNALANSGSIERIHGRGTFVKPAKYEHALHSAYSFHEQLSAEGFQITDEVLSRHVILAPADIALRLRVAPGSSLIYLARLRSANGTPMMLSVQHIPYDLCPGLLNDTFDTSLYQILNERYNLPVLSASDVFEARLPTADTSKRLKIPRRVPILYVERIAYTTDETVLHLGQTYIRADMYCFRTDLPARATSLMLKTADVHGDM